MIRRSQPISPCTYSETRVISTSPLIATVVPMTSRRLTGRGQGTADSTFRP
jgi:hypothetical protein